MVAALVRCAPSTTASEASALLSSAARLRLSRVDVPFEALLATALRILDGSATADLATSTSPALTGAASVAPPCTPLAASGLLWGLARLQPSGHEDYAEPVLKVVTQHMAAFTPLDTALIVWALSWLQWPLGTKERRAVRYMVRAAAPYLSARETAMVARGVASLRLCQRRSGSRVWAALYEAVGRAVGSVGYSAGAALALRRNRGHAPAVLCAAEAQIRCETCGAALQARRRRSPARRP